MREDLHKHGMLKLWFYASQIKLGRREADEFKAEALRFKQYISPVFIETIPIDNTESEKNQQGQVLKTLYHWQNTGDFDVAFFATGIRNAFSSAFAAPPARIFWHVHC